MKASIASTTQTAGAGDQCRRVVSESGMERVMLAGKFEAARAVAGADADRMSGSACWNNRSKPISRHGLLINRSGGRKYARISRWIGHV
jgi:hypothetical protein